MSSIPEGFDPLETESPFVVNVGPLYYRMNKDSVVLGLLIEEHHCNRGGRLHGAMVSAIGDLALGQNIGLQLANGGAFDKVDSTKVRGAPIATVSLSVDFAGTARMGDWVEAHVDVQRTGKRTAFANAYLFSGDNRIARISGVFQVMVS